MQTPPDCFLMTNRDDVIRSRLRSTRLQVDPARHPAGPRREHGL
jgi:hypothetical protein